MRSAVASHQKSWHWPIERIIKTASLRTTWEVAQELNIDHSMIIRRLKQIGKMKGLIKWCLMSWPQIKKKRNHHFEVTSSLILCSSEQFLAWIVACKEKCILYNNRQHQAQWLDREEAPKHFLKSNLHRKKVMVPVWWSVACLIHYSFLNPSKTITSEKYVQQIIEIHRKLLHLQLALVARMGLILLHENAWSHITQPLLQKLNELGYKVLLQPPFHLTSR